VCTTGVALTFVCLVFDILPSHWCVVCFVRAFLCSVLVTIRHLLREPSVDSPLEPDVAKEYQEKRDTFNKKAKDWVKKYAK
jgi:ubiquitin-protein ligase